MYVIYLLFTNKGPIFPRCLSSQALIGLGSKVCFSLTVLHRDIDSLIRIDLTCKFLCRPMTLLLMIYFV